MRIVNVASELTSSWLLVTGLAAALTLLAPSIVILVAITVIGIPLAIALALAPLVFIVSLGGALAHRWLKVGAMGYVIGAGATLLLLSVPAHFINADLSRRMSELVADDRDTFSPPLKAGTIAIRQDLEGWFERGETRCSGLCMLLLLDGHAARVMTLDGGVTPDIDPTRKVLSFRMERRDRCPYVKLSSSNEMYFISEEPGGWSRGLDQKTNQRMRAQIGLGNCLIQETVALGLADAIISVGAVNRGLSVEAAGLDPFADTLTAHRYSVHLRAASGYAEVYRQTNVVTYKLAPVLAPTVGGGFQLEGTAVLARFEERSDKGAASYPDRDRTLFLQKILRGGTTRKAEAPKSGGAALRLNQSF
ncbi:MAG: hypothetical protein KJS87_09235 [Alphaproteobacteria bacterium]|nr:hypothetical protein [Alphaproteobacteria bacterium]